MDLPDLEARLQSLVEIRLVGVEPGQKAEDLIVRKRTDAIKSDVVLPLDGTQIAPNSYRKFVPTDALPAWNNPEILATLIEILKTIGDANNHFLNGASSIPISGDPNLTRGEINWIAFHRVDILEERYENRSGC